MAKDKQGKLPEHTLTRRERQIMDVVFRERRATASQILDSIPNPPSLDAVRRLIRILEEKGFLAHEVDGPRHVYFPTVTPESARLSALDHLVQTHFRGSVSQAIAALLETSIDNIPAKDLENIVELIEESKKEGR